MLVHLTPCLATVVPVEKSEVKENKIPFNSEQLKTLETKAFSFYSKVPDFWTFFKNKKQELLVNNTESKILLFSKINESHLKKPDFSSFVGSKNTQLQYLGNMFVKPPQKEKTLKCIRKQALFCAFCGVLYNPSKFKKAYPWPNNTDFQDAVFQLKEIQELHDKKNEDFKKLRDQIKEAMAYTYKIHFSVAEKYLEWFFYDLMETLSNNDCFKYIQDLKVLDSYDKGTHFPKKNKTLENPLPIIVLYPCLIPGTKEEKNKILDPMIQTLVIRYGKVACNCSISLGSSY
jgi:hypothetical protein